MERAPTLRSLGDSRGIQLRHCFKLVKALQQGNARTTTTRLIDMRLRMQGREWRMRGQEHAWLCYLFLWNIGLGIESWISGRLGVMGVIDMMSYCDKQNFVYEILPSLIMDILS